MRRASRAVLFVCKIICLKRNSFWDPFLALWEDLISGPHFQYAVVRVYFAMTFYIPSLKQFPLVYILSAIKISFENSEKFALFAQFREEITLSHCSLDRFYGKKRKKRANVAKISNRTAWVGPSQWSSSAPFNARRWSRRSFSRSETRP